MVHFHVSLFNSKDFHEVHEKKLSLNQKHSQVLEKIWLKKLQALAFFLVSFFTQEILWSQLKIIDLRWLTLIAASVWMYTMSLSIPNSPLGLWRELTIPAVTVLLSFKGLPNAATHSPARTSEDLPSWRCGNLI